MSCLYFLLVSLLGIHGLPCAPKWSSLLTHTYTQGSKVCYENAEVSLHDNYHCYDTAHCKNAAIEPGGTSAWSDEGLCDSPCQLPACDLSISISGDGSYQLQTSPPECTVLTNLFVIADPGSVVGMVIIDDKTVFDGDGADQTEVNVQLVPMPGMEIRLIFTISMCPVLVTSNEGGTYSLEPPQQLCDTQANLKVESFKQSHISSVSENGKIIFESTSAKDACMSVRSGGNITIIFSPDLCPVHVDIMGSGTYLLAPPEQPCGTSAILSAQASAGYFLSRIRDDDNVVFTSEQDSSASISVESGSRVVLEFSERKCAVDVGLVGGGSYSFKPATISCGDTVTFEITAEPENYIHSFDGSGQSFHGEDCEDSLTKVIVVHNFMGEPISLEFKPRPRMTIATSDGVIATPASGPCGFTAKIDVDSLSDQFAIEAITMNDVELVKYHKHIYQRRRTIQMKIKENKTFKRSVKALSRGLIRLLVKTDSSSIQNGLMYLDNYYIGMGPYDSCLLDIPTSVWEPYLQDSPDEGFVLHFQGWNGASRMQVCNEEVGTFEQGTAQMYLQAFYDSISRQCALHHNTDDGSWVWDAVISIWE